MSDPRVGCSACSSRTGGRPRSRSRSSGSPSRTGGSIVWSSSTTPRRDESRAAVAGATRIAASVEHLEMAENLGFTGGVAAGMRRVLELADDRDWIVVLDDDDPVPYPTVFSELERFAEEMLERDPMTAGVGISGGRFDWRRGRIRRVPDRELHGPVPVDHVAGNQVPFYLVAAVRDAGHVPRAAVLRSLGDRVRPAGHAGRLLTSTPTATSGGGGGRRPGGSGWSSRPASASRR